MGQFEGTVFLTDEPEPRLGEEASLVVSGDGWGAVGAAGVDDDDFVYEGVQAFEAALEIGLFIESDEARRDLHEPTRREAIIGLVGVGGWRRERVCGRDF